VTRIYEEPHLKVSRCEIAYFIFIPQSRPTCDLYTL